MMKRIALCAVAAAIALARIPDKLVGLVPGYDLRAYITAARAVWRGLPFVGLQNAALMPASPVVVPAYVYPPLLAILLVPVGWLPDDAALLALRVLALLGTLFLIWALRHWCGTPVAFVAVLFLPATWESMYQGQINALVAAITLMALFRASGLWLAIGALLKMTPALLLPTFDRHTWARFALVCAGVVLITLPIAGLPAWIAPFGPPASCHPLLVGARGALCRVPTLLPLMPWFTIAVVGVSIWRRSPAALILAPLLIGPLVWPQSMILAVPAFAILWRGGDRRIAVLLWFGFAAAPDQFFVVVLALGWLYACAQPVHGGVMRTAAARR